MGPRRGQILSLLAEERMREFHRSPRQRVSDENLRFAKISFRYQQKYGKIRFVIQSKF